MQNNPPSRFLEEIDARDLEQESAVPENFAAGNFAVQTAPFANKDERARAQVYTPRVKPAGAVGAEKKGWNTGDQVDHKSWGRGVVVKVNGKGEDMELDIAFKDKGIKRL
ncbi:ATP-dependent DNA helicase PcrA, partial [Lactobacillus sp. XV13L]|nr:ATP-dependent DNA helicase PcrA [Lactobacillus sp. XV13L]